MEKPTRRVAQGDTMTFELLTGSTRANLLPNLTAQVEMIEMFGYRGFQPIHTFSMSTAEMIIFNQSRKHVIREHNLGLIGLSEIADEVHRTKGFVLV
jgi:hypothetical protein